MVRYDVTLFRDAPIGKHPKVRMETLNGTNVVIASKGIEYELTPRLGTQVCRIFDDAEEADATASLSGLPDIADWAYLGQQQFNGAAANVWRYERHHEAKIVQYTFYATPSGAPLRLHMLGNDVFSGAHFDQWIADYTGFEPGRPDASLFEKPELCDEIANTPIAGPSPAAFRMKSLAPAVQYGGKSAEYDAFLSSHGRGRRHASLREYNARLEVFSANAAMITAHNAENKSYTMAMNKFGDWTREEFQAIMLPKKQQRGKRGTSVLIENNKENKIMDKHELPYEPLTSIAALPSEIDWRGTGADSGVKDQANCGSCWAFGAVGAMESAWFHATGHISLFSEQQVMDCAWGYVPGSEDSASACDGGDAWAGIGHIVEAGGISAASDYQYLGQNDYCKEKSSPKTGKIRGFVRIPRYDDDALREAVYSRGPVAVSLDASQDSFTFYSSGIYYDTSCMWKPEDLDHSMMLVGYGTDPAGDYWLVKNSWSKYWGDGGYVKIARDGGGCGASTDAVYAVADTQDDSIKAQK